MSKLVNFVLFQVLWAITIYGVTIGNNWLAPAGLLAVLIIHYSFSATFKADLLLAFLAVLVGLAVETALVQFHILDYAQPLPFKQIAPFWTLILWANFALTMNGCIQWLQGKYYVAAILGAIGGPLSYFAGIELNAATTGVALALMLTVIAAIYAVTTPALLLLAKQCTQVIESGRDQTSVKM
jgi:hypothetical protein